MKDQTTKQASASQKPNILVRLLALLVTAALALGALTLVVYRDQFNLDAVKRWLAYRSIQGGARGLDMGRNIFQSNHPVEMAKAIRMIVHQKATDKEAFEFYTDAIHTR